MTGTLSIPGVMRQAAVDFYFNSLRFVPANLAWALALLCVLFAGLAWPPAIALTVLLAIPLVGIHRMAALLARGQATSLADFVDGMRALARQAVLTMLGLTLLAVVLVINLITGFGSGQPLGWFLGATALWGLVALSMFTVAVWPLLADPSRADTTLRRRLQLAALVVIGKPGRLFVVTALIASILAIATIVLGAIVLAGVSYASLLATRWVLPTVDELEARFEAARAR